ncbi:MAG: hypothetical protein K2J41_03590 [Eubacterium sp.]|nr:hypothetical protein [Eubacterium sp.]
MEVVAQRVFEPFYMWLDISFLVLFIGLLSPHLPRLVFFLFLQYQHIQFGLVHLVVLLFR